MTDPSGPTHEIQALLPNANHRSSHLSLVADGVVLFPHSGPFRSLFCRMLHPSCTVVMEKRQLISCMQEHAPQLPRVTARDNVTGGRHSMADVPSYYCSPKTGVSH